MRHKDKHRLLKLLQSSSKPYADSLIVESCVPEKYILASKDFAFDVVRFCLLNEEHALLFEFLDQLRNVKIAFQHPVLSLFFEFDGRHQLLTYLASNVRSKYSLEFF